MKPRKLFLIIASVTVSLFITTVFNAAADISNNNTDINAPVSGDVTGNSGGSNTITTLGTNPNVPQSASSESVHHNTLTISSSVTGTYSYAFGGITYGSGDVYLNTVIINSGGSVDGMVYGGWAFSGNVTDNEVTINSGATVQSNVFGGRSQGSGNASSNEINISGTVDNYVYGGYAAGGGYANDNTITILGGGSVGLNIFGGYAVGNGTASNNTIEIIGTANNYVYGGYTVGTGDASGNKIIVSGKAGHNIFGGYADGNGNASGNTIDISGTAGNYVYGGYAAGIGDASDNEIIVSGVAGHNIFGGYAYGNGAASNNTIIVSGKASNHVYGGYARGSGNVSGNEIEVSGSANWIYGGYSEGTGSVSGNSVTLSGTASGRVFGGYVTSANNSKVSDNIVTIANGGIANDNVFGGAAYGSAHVISNAVVIEDGGKVSGIVYGGWSDDSGSVTYNSVIIGGTVDGRVYAGYSVFGGVVNNNTITVESTADLSNASLSGRNNSASGNNSLIINGFSGDIWALSNFSSYEFILGQLNSSMTVVTIIGGTSANINNSDINITLASGFYRSILSAGDVVTVIDGITLNANPTTVTVAQTSPFIVYDFTETHNTGALQLTIDDVTLRPQASVISQSFMASLAFLEMAADLRIVPTGPLFVRRDLKVVPEGPHFTPFVTTSYGRQYIATGSSITIKGLSVLTGVAFHLDVNDGDRLTAGAFFEGGWGDYNSRNSFANSATIKGKGDTDYYGGGLLARYAMQGGLYSEASFATGKTSTDFKSWDLVADNVAKYNFEVPYYSAHVTLGQNLALSDRLNLDVYAKYLWTKQKGDTVDVQGYPFKFKDTDSHRVRGGGQLNANVSPQLQPYAGVAFEYELAGRTKGSLYGMQLEESSMRGGTGIGELGLVWTPGIAETLKVDLSVQGYGGKREGVSGGFTVTLSF